MSTASVVIPAHNEARGLRRCLSALLESARPGEFEIVVVANGCRDETARIARSFSVECVETPIASKSRALALGDDSASVFPRIYLDADVVISTGTARALASTLVSESRYLAAAPRMLVPLDGTSPLARAYLSVWRDLPVFRTGYVGSGCYALSQAGRSRFETFPDVIGDDRFINELFEPGEKCTLSDHQLLTVPPRTLRGIFRRSLRVRAGTTQLRSPGKRVVAEGTRSYLVERAATARELPNVIVFVVTQVVIAGATRVRRALRRDTVWLRDETSRV